MKNLKIGLVALAALVVLYAAAAWVVGMRAQSMLERIVQENNQRAARMFDGKLGRAGQATIRDYQRGVFSSRLRYTINLQGLVTGLGLDNAPQTEESVEFQLDLQHGPFPWELLRHGEFAPQMMYGQVRLLPTPLTQPWFDVAGEDALRLQARIGFAEDGSADLIIAPIVFKQDDDEVRFSGGQLHFIIANRFADSQATGGFAALDVLEDGYDVVRIRDMTITGRSHQGDEAMQSESHLEAASIDFDLPEVGAVRIEKFGIDVAVEQAAALVDYSVRYRLGGTQFNGRQTGAFDLGFSAKQVDLPSLLALLQTLEAAAQGDGDVDTDALQTQVRSLLKAQPTIAIDPVLWRTDKGESRVALTADLFASDDEDYVMFEDFGLQYVREANLTMDVSRAMALQVAGFTEEKENPLTQAMFGMLFDQYVSRLQSVGLVRVDGDQVHLNARYLGEDESVELNGTRMSLGEFAMLLMRTF